MTDSASSIRPAPPERLAPDYASARSDFLATATNAGARIEHHVHPLLGRLDEELAIDIARLGPAEATDWLVIVSATHGVEGFCGSALQTRFLETNPAVGDRAVLLVHGLNPHGFSWVRRVNEDNIDLNRNFVDWSAGPPHNGGYDSMAELLVPTTWDDETQARTLVALADRARADGVSVFQEEATGGQYRHPRGVFYGGSGPAWSNQRIAEVWDHHLVDAEVVTVVDLHTGLGPWGYGELITHEPVDSDGYRRAETLWGDVRSMRDGESVSANLQGDWLGHIHSWAGATEVTAVALEFGTIDMVSVLLALRADAWLHGYGDPHDSQGDEIRAQVRAAFADDDPAWIAACWQRFVDVLEPLVPLR